MNLKRGKRARTISNRIVEGYSGQDFFSEMPPGRAVTLVQAAKNKAVLLKCPVCEASSAFEYSTSEADLWRCPDCGHCFTDIRSLKAHEKYTTEYFEITHLNGFSNPHIHLFETLRSFIAKNRPDASVIDFGCCNGAFLKYVRRKDSHLSLTRIDIAHNEPVGGIRFMQDDVLATDFDRQYDVVVSLAVIEHVADVRMFIRCLYSICAPQGYLIIMILNERSVLYRVAGLLCGLTYRAPLERLYRAHHLNHFTHSSLRQLVKSNGFSVVKTLRHNIPLAAIDFDSRSLVGSAILRAGVWETFVAGLLTGQTYLQTVICRKNQQGI